MNHHAIPQELPRTLKQNKYELDFLSYCLHDEYRLVTTGAWTARVEGRISTLKATIKNQQAKEILGE